MTSLTLAHDYVRRGWGVVPLYGFNPEAGTCRCTAGKMCPLKNAGKHPHGTRGGWRILTSGADVQAHYDEHPTDNIGIATGPEYGLFVGDVDGAHGVRSIAELAAEHGALPPTRIIRTGSGGLHYYFRHPGHFKVHGSTSWLAPGIDIRGVGGQVVAPPSVSGRGAYEVIADLPIAEAPAWLLERLHEHARHVEDGRKAEVKGAERVDVEFLPEAIQTLRSTLVGDGGRHQHFHALVAACYENGYTQGQAVTIAAPWCVAVDKFVGRVEQEVARCWGKLEAEKAKEREWLGDDPAPAPKGPDSADSGTTPLPEPVTASDNTTPPGLTDDDHDEAVALPATWAPVNLDAILDGTYEPELPALMPRTDGANLLYAGRVHSFHGESESGKSLVAQAEAVRVLQAGGDVAYLDFESDAAAITGRMLELGATPDQLRDRFQYRRPDTDPRRFATDRDDYVAFVSRPWTYVVLDGMTDALGVFGYGTQDNDEIAAFMRFLRRITVRTGAALVIVDHVTKDTESRGRFALGGQAKMNALDGAAYTVEVKEALGRGLRGRVELRVAKDRPGGVRPHSGAFRRDRTQEAAQVIVDSTAGDGILVTVEPPEGRVGDPVKAFRPTGYMVDVCAVLEAEGPLSKTRLRTAIREYRQEKRIEKTSNPDVDAALRALVDEGYVNRVGDGAATRYLLVSTYFEGAEIIPKDTPCQTLPNPASGEDWLHPAKPLPPYGAGQGAKGRGNTPTLPDRAEVELAACGSCFRPVPSNVLDALGGTCASCKRANGEAPS